MNAVKLRDFGSKRRRTVPCWAGHRTLLYAFLALGLFSSTAIQAELPIAEQKLPRPVDFASDVYPVLKANCLACHNSTKAKASLVLESPAAMLQGGDSGPAVEPGRSAKSLLFLTALHREEPIMPPPNNKAKATNLSPGELALLRQWIEEGAKGEAVAPPPQSPGLCCPLPSPFLPRHSPATADLQR